MGQTRPLFICVCPLLVTMTKIVQWTLIGKSITDALGIQTTELWRPHNTAYLFHLLLYYRGQMSICYHLECGQIGND